MKLPLSLGLCLALIHLSAGSKILFFFARSTYSHRIVVWPLAEELAARGHDVTFVQAYPPKKPNPKIKEFYPKSLLNAVRIDSLNLLKLRLEGGRGAMISSSRNNVMKSVDECAKFLNEPETQEWMENCKNFDLVIIDDLHNECGYGLAHKFGAKTALFVTSHPTVRRFEPLGILLETSWIPDLKLAPQLPMSFLERAENTLEPLKEYFWRQWFYYPKLDQVIRESLRMPDMPSVAALERETSLVFANTHFSEEFARALPPMFVSVGGMHCEDSSQALTKELEEFINKTDGFIYVSFGSAARISDAPEEFQNIFYQAMTNSKMHFVWKYEGQRNAKIPSNVFVSNWLPQQAILAHPKIKAYFTHGGLLGIQEAVWHGVPLLAMPVFAEQDYNSMRVHRTERGIMLDPNTLTLEMLQEALKNVVEDPKYKDNMAKLSSKFKDRPAKAVDTAVWWTEYILRHGNNTDVKPLGIEQNWLVRRSLDVWAVVFSAMFATLAVAMVIVRKFVKVLSLMWKAKVKVN